MKFLFPLILIALLVFKSFSQNDPPISLTYKVRLEWDPNSETDLAGYKVYYGTNSGSYLKVINLPGVTNSPNATVEVSWGVTNFFVVTAYNLSGLESDPSNEVFHFNSFTNLLSTPADLILTNKMVNP